ncbi:MAG: PhoH family protein [Atopobiaceae bacterium]|nr:PhoH family protein [Atopobiaceae bacterium]
MEPTQIRLTIPDSVDPTRLMGPADSLLRRIEQAFDAMVVVRGNTITISGAIEVVEQASTVFSRLMRQVEVGEAPTVDDVDVVIEHAKHGASGYSILSDDVLLTYRGRTIRPKTAGQKRYIDSIRSNTITFGIGPAGTGKTYLAMACAVAALKRREVGRIVLCRPVVEAGESLGFLPGTLEEKLDPYVRPLYDALFDMTDMEKGNALIEQGVIEIAPLAFMRGRTLNDAFVILDEAQNTTPEQMKMFLTRLGFSSKFVVTGDATQRDLLGKSGLDQAREVLEGIEGISFIDLDRNDIVRHSLVARIVDAFARGEGGDARGSRDR